MQYPATAAPQSWDSQLSQRTRSVQQRARQTSGWRLTGAWLMSLLLVAPLMAQVPPPIYDEAEIPEYTLPDPFVTFAGQPVKTAEAWWETRRSEILEAFSREMFGRSPAGPSSVQAKLVNRNENALGGKAVREEIDITLAAGPPPLTMRVLVYRPKGKSNVPSFLGLNFGGNHSVQDDPEITLNPNWFRNRPDRGYINNRATEESRGKSASRWPVETIIDRGYAVATIYYGDIDPDEHDGFKNGIHQYHRDTSQETWPADHWGSISAWAWGLSRALDYFETDDNIDATRVAVLGHSRLGKTSLWAGAQDQRFALVISNNSGCGGAALSRRRFGESVTRINTSFPHWFCDNFKKYNHKEEELPIDQHLLLALIAPRPVYVASAVEDRWADPHGEFLSARFADPVYRLLGTAGFGGEAPPAQQPAVDHPLKTGAIGYHVRSGGHDINAYDWAQYLDFADLHFRKTDGK